MKRGLILLLIVLISLITNGCWNRTELNRLAIINAIAFDLNEANQWIFTFQTIIPQTAQGEAGGGASQAPVTVFSSKGTSIGEAIQKIELEAPRRPFFSHTRVVVISRRVAEYGIHQFLDFYLRDIQTRGTANLLITEGDANNVLEVLTPLETIPGNAISKLIGGEMGESQFNLTPTEIHDFVTALANPYSSAVLPEIKISGRREGQTSLEALQETRNQAVLKLDRVAVLKQDKFAGWLSRKESLGLPWITNRIHRTTVSFPCKGVNRGNDSSSYVIDSSRTKLHPKISDGHLMMSVEIDAKGNLLETACSLNLREPGTLKDLEKNIQEKIKNDVQETFQALKKMKADALGFGDAFHKACPQDWKKISKNWEDEFAKIRMDVTVKATIRNTGMINGSFPGTSGK